MLELPIQDCSSVEQRLFAERVMTTVKPSHVSVQSGVTVVARASCGVARLSMDMRFFDGRRVAIIIIVGTSYEAGRQAAGFR